MDNADLEKLSVVPGRLSPKFNPNVTEYSVTLGSDVKQIKIDPLTSDSGASYCISGGDGGKSVPLKEGQTTAVKIEVTAEDGSTIKNYFVHATRLSPSDSSLSGLGVSNGQLSPQFDPQITSYSVTVPYFCVGITVSPSTADKKTELKLNGGGNFAEPIPLNYGETKVNVEVLSADKSRNQTYQLVVCRLQVLRPVKFVEEKQKTKFECPVCLGALYRPKSIESSSPKHTFCKVCIDELTRTCKQDPLDGTPLKGDWRVDENALETELSSQLVHCVYHHWGCQEKPALRDLGGHAKLCEFRPVMVEKTLELVAKKDLDDKTKDPSATCPDCSRQLRAADLETHKTYTCPVKHASRAIQHKVELRSWEKKLQRETNEKSGDKLAQLAEEQIQQYFKALPCRGHSGQFDDETSPLKYLTTAAEWYATASKLAPKNAKFHFLLAQVLEEQHFAQDLYGLKLPKSSPDEDDFGFSTKLKISTEEEDTQALCEMRGVGKNAPLALQLKAIDEEYHYLLDQGQSDKADYVQKLYALKSQQLSKEANKTARMAGSEEEPLGKAFCKYLDALACCPEDSLYNLHVGRLLLLQGKLDEASVRLQAAVGLKPMNPENRFYLGLALCEQKGGPGPRTVEAAKYVSEGLEHILQNKLTSDAENADQESGKKCRTDLLSGALLRFDNVHCLQACNRLGNLASKLSSLPAGVMSAVEAYRTTTLLSSRMLSQMVARGDTYHHAQWLLFEAQSFLLQMMLESGDKSGESGPSDAISRYCENLSGLITCSSLPPDGRVCQLQEKTCQQAVILQPCSSQALYRLGDAQLRCYDNNPTAEGSARILAEVEQSFRTSMQLEGQPCEGGMVPSVISEQQWFKQREAKRKAEMKAKESPASQKTAASTAPGGRPGAKAATRGRGAPRGGAGGRGTAPPTRGGGASAAKPSTGTARGKTSPTKGAAPTAGRGAARGGRATGAAVKPAGSTSKPAQSAVHKAGACAAAPAKTAQNTKAKGASAPSPAPEPAPSPQSEPKASGPPNKPSYQARLGLARVLSRKGGDAATESHKLYEEVIDMAPEFHDAYIELADCLVGRDPMKAVDVYSKYPFTEPLTFDDAYIYGEIVRLLMKKEQYDDPRLPPALISLGKVLGLTVIEKHVEALDKTFKHSKLLMEVYAGVHGKAVDDPDLQQFFKFKCWI